MADGRVYATLAPAHTTPVKFRHGMLRFEGEPGKTCELPEADFALLKKRGIVVEAAKPAPPQPAIRNMQPEKE